MNIKKAIIASALTFAVSLCSACVMSTDKKEAETAPVGIEIVTLEERETDSSDRFYEVITRQEFKKLSESVGHSHAESFRRYAEKIKHPGRYELVPNLYSDFFSENFAGMDSLDRFECVEAFTSVLEYFNNKSDILDSDLRTYTYTLNALLELIEKDENLSENALADRILIIREQIDGFLTR